MGPIRADTALTIRFLCFALRDSAMRRRSARQPSWPPPAASLSVGGTTPDIFVARLHDLGTAWHELKRVVPRSASPPTQARLIVMIEGGAVPCLSPVVTDFPEISRKFEGLRLELVSRNFALVQQKCTPGPSQQWWKGVGGDYGGVPSRGDTSKVLTYVPSEKK